jgi:hypothetical protein
MSLNRESFDRFNDSVCEMLFSYLSISDKVKFECVSKQWQSLVFSKHKDIIINESIRHINKTLEISHNFWEKNQISIIECLTKKFKYINNLEINFEINNQSLEIITKNCGNLTKIQCFGFLSENFCETFGQKCGHNLEFIDIFGIEESETLKILKLTPKLKAIELYDNFDAVIKQNLSNLEEIKFNDFSSDSFGKFANLYNKQIKKISFNDWSNEKQEVAHRLLLFENLESLSFRILKNFYYNWNQILSLAKNLKKLQRLSINACKVSFSFECLTVFNNLKVLNLVFDEFEDQDMKFIEKLHLTKLHINSCNFLKSESLLKLSKMERLSELRLFSSFMTDSGISQLIKNSPNLKFIELYEKHINDTTVKAFIEKALSYPKTLYKLMSHYINRKPFFRNDIPKNLFIKK